MVVSIAYITTLNKVGQMGYWQFYWLLLPFFLVVKFYVSSTRILRVLVIDRSNSHRDDSKSLYGIDMRCIDWLGSVIFLFNVFYWMIAHCDILRTIQYNAFRISWLPPSRFTPSICASWMAWRVLVAQAWAKMKWRNQKDLVWTCGKSAERW